MRYLRRLYPRRLRNQIRPTAILMVIVPTLSIGYIVETEGLISRSYLKKEKKLSAVVHLLDEALVSFTQQENLPRDERIRALNAQLSPVTERITRVFPGIGAGYYNKALDAIITYAPSALYQNNVGSLSLPDYPGREVMSTNAPVVFSGRQVRGDILNSMIPIARHGEVIGVISGRTS